MNPDMLLALNKTFEGCIISTDDGVKSKRNFVSVSIFLNQISISENVEKIEVVHIHDWIKGLKSHQIVRDGEIDFKPSLQLLSTLTRPAQYVFEVRPRSAAQESLNAFVDLLKELNIELV